LTSLLHRAGAAPPPLRLTARAAVPPGPTAA
jgi:hypothetical protein